MASASPSGGQPPSFKTNVNRAKTKRWVEAKSYSYDGDDWGEYDDYDEYGQEEESPRPTGLRQRGQSINQESPTHGTSSPVARTPNRPPDQHAMNPRSVTNPISHQNPGGPSAGPPGPPDDRRAFSTGGPSPNRAQGPYPGQSMPQYAQSPHGAPGPGSFPSGPPVRPGSENQQRYSGSGHTGNLQLYTGALHDRTQSMSSNISSRDWYDNGASPANRAHPVSAQPGAGPQMYDDQLRSRAPRKSSLSQQNQPLPPPDPAAPASVFADGPQRDRAGSSASSTNPPAFVRPADIYKRIEEERVRERQSLDSSRPSIDQKGNVSSEKSSIDSRRDPEPNTRLQSKLDPVNERRSEYGLEGIETKQSQDPEIEQAQMPKRRTTSKTFELLKPSPGSTTSKSCTSSLQPSQSFLPDLNRVSGFGEGFGEGFGASFMGSDSPFGELSSTAAPPSQSSTATSAPKTEETKSIKDLQHQPSKGFTSAVHQAFDEAQEQVPPTPSSTADSSVGRSTSGGTSVVSPVMSRGPSAVDTGVRRELPIIEDVASPSSEADFEAKSRHSHAGSVSTLKPAPHTRGDPLTEEADLPPGFKSGHRRDASTPSPDNSPARTPQLASMSHLRHPHQVDLAQSTPTPTDSAPSASNSLREAEPPGPAVDLRQAVQTPGHASLGRGPDQSSAPPNEREHKNDSGIPGKNPQDTRDPSTSAFAATAQAGRDMADAMVAADAGGTAQPLTDAKADEPQANSPHANLGEQTPTQHATFPEAAAPKPPPSPRQLANLPALSTQAQRQSDEYESDRLRREIVKELTPGLQSDPTTAESDSPYQSSSRYPTNETMRSAGTGGASLPSEYDKYWEEGFDQGKAPQPLSPRSPAVATEQTPNSATAEEQRSALAPSRTTSSIPDGAPSLTRRFSWEQPLAELSSPADTSKKANPAASKYGSVKDNPFKEQEEKQVSAPPTEYQKLGSELSTLPEPVPTELEAEGSPSRGQPAPQSHADEAMDTTSRPGQPHLDELQPQPISKDEPVVENGKIDALPPSVVTDHGESQTDLPIPEVPSKIDDSTIPPAGSAIQPKLPVYREIMASKSTADRIRGLQAAQEQIAGINTGLAHWLGTILDGLPEHQDMLSNGGKLRAAGPNHGHSPSASKTGNKAGGQPYYQQYLDASPQSATPGGAGGAGPTGTPAAPGAQSAGGKSSGQQVQAKGKELLHSAGVFGGKANVAAKGLFSKGKSKLRDASGSRKAPSIPAASAVPRQNGPGMQTFHVASPDRSGNQRAMKAKSNFNDSSSEVFASNSEGLKPTESAAALHDRRSSRSLVQSQLGDDERSEDSRDERRPNVIARISQNAQKRLSKGSATVSTRSTGAATISSVQATPKGSTPLDQDVDSTRREHGRSEPQAVDSSGQNVESSSPSSRNLSPPPKASSQPSHPPTSRFSTQIPIRFGSKDIRSAPRLKAEEQKLATQREQEPETKLVHSSSVKHHIDVDHPPEFYYESGESEMPSDNQPMQQPQNSQATPKASGPSTNMNMKETNTLPANPSGHLRLPSADISMRRPSTDSQRPSGTIQDQPVSPISAQIPSPTRPHIEVPTANVNPSVAQEEQLNFPETPKSSSQEVHHPGARDQSGPDLRNHPAFRVQPSAPEIKPQITMKFNHETKIGSDQAEHLQHHPTVPGTRRIHAVPTTPANTEEDDEFPPRKKSAAAAVQGDGQGKKKKNRFSAMGSLFSKSGFRRQSESGQETTLAQPQQQVEAAGALDNQAQNLAPSRPFHQPSRSTSVVPLYEGFYAPKRASDGTRASKKREEAKISSPETRQLTDQRESSAYAQDLSIRNKTQPPAATTKRTWNSLRNEATQSATQAQSPTSGGDGGKGAWLRFPSHTRSKSIDLLDKVRTGVSSNTSAPTPGSGFGPLGTTTTAEAVKPINAKPGNAAAPTDAPRSTASKREESPPPPAPPPKDEWHRARPRQSSLPTPALGHERSLSAGQPSGQSPEDRVEEQDEEPGALRSRLRQSLPPLRIDTSFPSPHLGPIKSGMSSASTAAGLGRAQTNTSRAMSPEEKRRSRQREIEMSPFTNSSTTSNAPGSSAAAHAPNASQKESNVQSQREIKQKEKRRSRQREIETAYMDHQPQRQQVQSSEPSSLTRPISVSAGPAKTYTFPTVTTTTTTTTRPISGGVNDNNSKNNQRPQGPSRGSTSTSITTTTITHPEDGANQSQRSNTNINASTNTNGDKPSKRSSAHGTNLPNSASSPALQTKTAAPAPTHHKEDKEEEEELVVMSATSFPGQEWQPAGWDTWAAD